MSYIRNFFVVKKCLKGSKSLSSSASESHYLLSTTHGPLQDLPWDSRASHQIAHTCSLEHGNKVTWVSQLSKMYIVLFNILGILYTNTYFFNKKTPFVCCNQTRLITLINRYMGVIFELNQQGRDESKRIGGLTCEDI